MGVDALGLHRKIVLAARAEIERLCGIPGAAVMIGASYSHSSGPVGMVLPGEYDGASAEVQRLAYEQSSLADACVPAEIGFGRGHPSS